MVDGILVVNLRGEVQTYNRNFLELWNIPTEVADSGIRQEILQYVIEQLDDPREFAERLRYVYDHPDEESNDTIRLKDGTGLGLVLASRLAAAMNGSLSVTSQVGVGSNFCIELAQA